MKRSMTAMLLLLTAALLTACSAEESSFAPEITVQTETVTEATVTETEALPDTEPEASQAPEESALPEAEAAPETPVLANTTGFGDLLSFSAETLDGGTFDNAGLADADVTVINLWATFCGPCIAEMPEIAAFQGTLPENVQLITCCVDITDSGTLQSAKSILSDAGYSGTTLLNPTGDLQTLTYAMMYVPTTVFVDSEGHLLGDAIIGGGNVKENYTARINEALLAMGKEPLAE